MGDKRDIHLDLPAAVLRVIELLEDGGFEAYVVGGCVRDALMGRACSDYDVTTNALCSQMEPLFAAAGLRVIETGIAHGTITVLADADTAGKGAGAGVFAERSSSEGPCPESPSGDDRVLPIEVTTYRVDGPYLDSRHPESVSFTRDLREDLARRDFTINAMAYSPKRGLVDLYGGRDDLAAGVIRAVGDADKRFKEDALRIMRALRFAAQLEFTIESATAAALRENAPLLANIAVERCAAELVKLVCGPGFRMPIQDYTEVLGVVLPELLPMKGCEQNNAYHPYDVLGHTLVAMENIPAQPELRMAALLHDCGKPATYNDGGPNQFNPQQDRRHFFNHPAVGAKIARAALERLHYPRDFIEMVVFVVGEHDAYLKEDDVNIKQWLHRIGPERMSALLYMKHADISALDPRCHEWLPIFDRIRANMERILASGGLLVARAVGREGRRPDRRRCGTGAGTGGDARAPARCCHRR